MTMQIVLTYAAAVCLIIGVAFTIVGAIGLLKFSDPMTRLHAPTKVGTMGIGALLLASMLHAYADGEGSMHEALIMAFLFVTAPISANFMAKVNIHRRASATPKPPTRDESWSTLNVPEADREIVETR